MSELYPFIVTGLVTGSLYGLAGVGLVLTYRTSGVFNFGHGAIAALAAFLFHELHVEHGIAWPISAVVCIVLVGGVVGLVMERISRGLADAPASVAVVATVGVFLAVQGSLQLQFGQVLRQFPEFLPTTGFEVAGVRISWSQVISFLVATVGTGALYVYLRSSRLGVSMRAAVDNPTLLSLGGTRPARVRLAAWMIGSGFAAVTGILLAPTLGLDAILLTMLVVQAFGACAIGRFSSLPLTYAGGLLVGVAASMSTKWFTRPPLSGVASIVPILALILVLLVVPARLLPQRRITFALPTSSSTMALPARVRVPLYAVGAAALVAVPWVVDTKLPIWTGALSYSIIFASLAMLVWGSGQISLCHLAFAALGATTMSHLDGLSWPFALLCAGLLTVPVGALVAIPAIRLSGLYLALITLGFGICMQNVIFATSWMFGSGLVVEADRPVWGSLDGTDDRTYYFIVLAVAALSFVALAAILRTRLGRLLGGLAESPTTLATNGLTVPTTRLLAFCISSFFAAIGGALIITQYGAASGVAFGPIPSLLLLAVLTICGTHPTRGAILAAALYGVLPGYADAFSAEWQTTVFGLVTVLAAIAAARRAELTAWFEAHTLPTRPSSRYERTGGARRRRGLVRAEASS